MSGNNGMVELQDRAAIEETEELLDPVDRPIIVNKLTRKERCERWLLTRCDLRNYCCYDSNDEKRRPDCRLVLMFCGIIAVFGFIMLPLGIWAVYDYKHYTPTKFTVDHYDVEQRFCSSSMMSDDDESAWSSPWTIHVYGRYPDYYYDANGTLRERLDSNGHRVFWVGDWIRVCGSYADQGLAKAKQKYPVGMMIPAWIWDDGQGSLSFKDPASNLPFIKIFAFCTGLGLFALLLHEMTVLCCGFRGITELEDYRIVDPYRKV